MFRSHAIGLLTAVAAQVTAKPVEIPYSEHYEVVYEGLLKVESPGVQRLALNSDDGSKLYVHGELVIDNGGNHAAQIRTAWVDLAAGFHPIRIECYEDEGLELQQENEDGEYVSVPAEFLFHEPQEDEPQEDEPQQDEPQQDESQADEADRGGESS